MDNINLSWCHCIRSVVNNVYVELQMIDLLFLGVSCGHDALTGGAFVTFHYYKN